MNEEVDWTPIAEGIASGWPDGLVKEWAPNPEGRCKHCAHTIEAHRHTSPGECMVQICDCPMWEEGTGNERPR